MIDADGLVVGRVATIIANILRGKHKPSFTPHVDCGDNVVVINADKIRFTGKKADDKRSIIRHTGYAGGIKEASPPQGAGGPLPGARAGEGRGAHDPARAARPRADAPPARLCNGAEHPHAAQNPDRPRRRVDEPQEQGGA